MPECYDHNNKDQFGAIGMTVETMAQAVGRTIEVAKQAEVHTVSQFVEIVEERILKDADFRRAVAYDWQRFFSTQAMEAIKVMTDILSEVSKNPFKMPGCEKRECSACQAKDLCERVRKGMP